MSVRDVLYFDSMLTPKVVTLVARAMIITLGGAIGARICCQLMIVLFKLNENIQRLANQKQ